METHSCVIYTSRLHMQTLLSMKKKSHFNMSHSFTVYASSVYRAASLCLCDMGCLERKIDLTEIRYCNSLSSDANTPQPWLEQLARLEQRLVYFDLSREKFLNTHTHTHTQSYPQLLSCAILARSIRINHKLTKSHLSHGSQ